MARKVLRWRGSNGMDRLQLSQPAQVLAREADKLRWQYELQSNETKRIQFAQKLIAEN